MLAALTAGVLAADASAIPTQVVVSGTDVTKGGCWTVESDGTLTPGGDPTRPGSVAYDAVRGVLTLHEVQLQRPCIDESIGFHEDAAIFAQDGDLTLVLKGKNSVDGYMVANGIYVRDGDLTVDGDGEMAMTIIQWKSFRYGSYGLYSTQDIAIQGGTLKLPGELAPDGSAVRALGIQGNGNVFVPTAEWEYLYKNDGTLLETQLPFDDVSDGDWFYEDVKTACTTGLMSGVGDRRFAPEEPASRAMVVTILWRQAGCPQGQEKTAWAVGVPG